MTDSIAIQRCMQKRTRRLRLPASIAPRRLASQPAGVGPRGGFCRAPTRTCTRNSNFVLRNSRVLRVACCAMSACVVCSACCVRSARSPFPREACGAARVAGSRAHVCKCRRNYYRSQKQRAWHEPAYPDPTPAALRDQHSVMRRHLSERGW